MGGFLGTKSTGGITKKSIANGYNNNEQKYNNNSIKKNGFAKSKLENINENEETNYKTPQKTLTVNDFTFLKVVGKGSFGKVMQVRKNDSGEIFAMKVLKKKELLKKKQVIHTKTERMVLTKLKHPFIVSLKYSFQTEAKLYMILDFFNGGELFFHLKREGRFSEKKK